jgi:hypothetical protein
VWSADQRAERALHAFGRTRGQRQVCRVARVAVTLLDEGSDLFAHKLEADGIGVCSHAIAARASVIFPCALQDVCSVEPRAIKHALLHQLWMVERRGDLAVERYWRLLHCVGVSNIASHELCKVSRGLASFQSALQLGSLVDHLSSHRILHVDHALVKICDITNPKGRPGIDGQFARAPTHDGDNDVPCLSRPNRRSSGASLVFRHKSVQ